MGKEVASLAHSSSAVMTVYPGAFESYIAQKISWSLWTVMLVKSETIILIQNH